MSSEYFLDPQPICCHGVIDYWIVNQYNEECGRITEYPNGFRRWEFLGITLNPLKSINDPSLLEKCPDLVNDMLIYLVHHG